jgi:hypothetical protein
MSGVPGTYRNGWAPEKREEGYGTIGVLTAERGTYAAFWNDVQRAHMRMLVEHPRNTMDIRMGVDICGALNSMIRNLRGDWLWIMGDDHAFDPELLPRLLAHEVDVVVPHCLRRNPPWQPVVNSHEDEDGWQVAAELPEEGLTPIWSAGSAGMLIRRRVFEAIGDPWFTPAPDAVGLNEDINFCRKVREAGFTLWCDPAALLGHISNYTVWPRFDDGRWHLEHVFDQQTRVPIRRLAAEEPVTA